MWCKNTAKSRRKNTFACGKLSKKFERKNKPRQKMRSFSHSAYIFQDLFWMALTGTLGRTEKIFPLFFARTVPQMRFQTVFSAFNLHVAILQVQGSNNLCSKREHFLTSIFTYIICFNGSEKWMCILRKFTSLRLRQHRTWTFLALFRSFS